MEASTAVKGQILAELLEFWFEKIIYLGPNTAVFDALGSALLLTKVITTTPEGTPRCSRSDAGKSVP